MSLSEQRGSATQEPDLRHQEGWEAALRELQHQAIHLEARGAHRSAVVLYDAIRIARLGGLPCREHSPS